MRVVLVLCLLAGVATAQTVTTVTANANVTSAQSLPTDADVTQVLRALALLRGTPAIVPLTDANNVPLPVQTPVVVVPTPVPAIAPEPVTRALDAPAMGVRIRRSFPIGSLLTPKNVRGF